LKNGLGLMGISFSKYKEQQGLASRWVLGHKPTIHHDQEEEALC
jgi:hypothetical protein